MPSESALQPLPGKLWCEKGELMIIKELHIKAFGPILDTVLTLNEGLNVIEGPNESGKSSIAMFIKFIFYGLSGKSAPGGVSERSLYVNHSASTASGYLLFTVINGNKLRNLRLERTLNCRTDSDGKNRYSERVKCFDDDTGMPVELSGVPGEHFFGVPEQVFLGSAFARQGVDVCPDSTTLKEAVENIICAADENVSVKKALDLIDRARIKLLHKNRTGGEILELERNLSRVSEDLENARAVSARLIKAEISLSDVKTNIETAKEKIADLEEISEVLSVIDKKSVCGEAAVNEAKIRKLKGERAALDKSEINEQFRSSFTLSLREWDKYKKAKSAVAAIEKKMADVFPPCDEGEDYPVPAQEIAVARKCKKIAKALIIPAIILFVLGAITLAVSFILKNSPHHFALLCASVGIVATGAVFALISAVEKGAAKDVFKDWQVSSMDELCEVCGEASELYIEYEEARDEFFAAKKAGEEAAETIEYLAAVSKVVGEYEEVTTEEILRRIAVAVKENSDKKSSLDTEIARAEGVAESFKKTTGSDSFESCTAALAKFDTKTVEKASAMTAEERANISREFGFLKQKTELLHAKELDLERECATLKASGVSIANLSETKETLENEIRALKKRHEAYLLATDSIKAASENIRTSVVPALTKSASDIMGCITAGRYESIGVTSSFGMNFFTEDMGTLEVDYLSMGTREAAYIALRLALVKALFADKCTPPVVLDESLTSMDTDRIKGAISALNASGLQILLFTCKEFPVDLGKASHTKLPSPNGGDRL